MSTMFGASNFEPHTVEYVSSLLQKENDPPSQGMLVLLDQMIEEFGNPDECTLKFRFGGWIECTLSYSDAYRHLYVDPNGDDASEFMRSVYGVPKLESILIGSNTLKKLNRLFEDWNNQHSKNPFPGPSKFGEHLRVGKKEWK